MQTDHTCVHFLEVDTREFVRALRRLLRIEKSSKWISYRFQHGALTLSAGTTAQEVRATGAWAGPVWLERSFAEAMYKVPYGVKVTTLRVNRNQLIMRDFAVTCRRDQPDKYEGEDYLAGAVARAVRVLDCPEEEEKRLHALVVARGDQGSPWSPGDEQLLRRVKDIWLEWFHLGVEPLDVRFVLTKKLRDSWKHAGSARMWYILSSEDETHLRACARPDRAVPWRHVPMHQVRQIGAAWELLAPYGIAPLDILQLLWSPLDSNEARIS